MAEYIGYTFNKGIRSFGEGKIKLLLESFYNRYKLPIVSIGSGSGSIEHTTNSTIEWILIDPNPSSYNDNVIMEPHYSYVDTLINNKPNIIGNSVLFLNWCNPNESDYDYEAILKLKPIAVFSIYEQYYNSYGAAGGENFFQWTLTNEDSYTLIEEHFLEPHDLEEDEETMNIMIKIWQSTQIPFKDEDFITTYTKSLIRHGCGPCCIS